VGYLGDQNGVRRILLKWMLEECKKVNRIHLAQDSVHWLCKVQYFVRSTGLMAK
jgi:hypothetical protein